MSSFIFAEKIAIQVYFFVLSFFLFKQASKKTTKMLSSSSFARAFTFDQTQTVILLLPQAALLPGSDMAFCYASIEFRHPKPSDLVLRASKMNDQDD